MTGDNEARAIAAIRDAPMTRLTTSTSSTVGGFVVVSDSPEELAARAGVSLDVYSLARMISSEDGSAGAEVLLALAETTRNYARTGGVTVHKLLTRSSKSVAAGKYSEQAAGKWASTRLDPSYRHVLAAISALQDETDFVDNAIDFFDPRSQDGGTQGSHTLRKTSEQYISEQYAKGLQWVGPLPGINPYRLMLFARGGYGTLDDAYAILQSGRDGGDVTPGPAIALPTGDFKIDSGAGVIAAIGAGVLFAAKYFEVI